MTRRFNKRAALSTVALAAIMTSHPASAQTSTASAPAPTADAASAKTDTNSTLQEVVVTARKGVAESVQKIPEAIRAIGAKEIEAAGIVRLQEAVLLTPNIVINPSYRMGVVNLSSRGHSTPQQGDAPMVINFDGVQAPAQDFINQDLFDIDRIEILKGPQPLYGAGAIAGAINVITAAPTNDYEGFIKATLGNGDSSRVAAGFSGPIIEDKLFFRISGVDTNRDGLIKNTLSGDPVDFLHEQSIRASLLGVFDSLRVTLTGGYTKTPNAGASYYESIPLKPDPVPQIDSLFGGPLGRLGSNLSGANFENTHERPEHPVRRLPRAARGARANVSDAGGARLMESLGLRRSLPPAPALPGPTPGRTGIGCRWRFTRRRSGRSSCASS
jgi:outer membrane receptor protein involved in Fe transport